MYNNIHGKLDGERFSITKSEIVGGNVLYSSVQGKRLLGRDWKSFSLYQPFRVPYTCLNPEI